LGFIATFLLTYFCDPILASQALEVLQLYINNYRDEMVAMLRHHGVIKRWLYGVGQINVVLLPPQNQRKRQAWLFVSINQHTHM
jgi:hypothetical protein